MDYVARVTAVAVNGRLRRADHTPEVDAVVQEVVRELPEAVGIAPVVVVGDHPLPRLDDLFRPSGGHRDPSASTTYQSNAA